MATFFNRYIEDTYQFVLQDEGGILQDGQGNYLTSLNLTGSVLYSGSYSGSFGGDRIILTDSGSVITGSFTGSFTGHADITGLTASGEFTGDLTGSFTGSATGSFVGNHYGSHSGSFEGDGSFLTGVTADIGAIFNAATHTYSASNSNDEVVVKSTANLYTNLNWNRTGSVLNIDRGNHQLVADDRIIVRNANINEFYGTVSGSSTSGRIVISGVPNEGDVSGSIAAYSPAFRISGSANFDNGVELIAPVSESVRVDSLDLYIEDSQVNTKNINVPALGTTLKNRTIPIIQAYNAAGNQITRINGASVLFDTNSTDFGLYKVNGGLDTFGKVIVTLKF